MSMNSNNMTGDTKCYQRVKRCDVTESERSGGMVTITLC